AFPRGTMKVIGSRRIQGGSGILSSWPSVRLGIGTWRKWKQRMSVLASKHGSAGFRAAGWNTYIAACVPFPSQICLPNAHACKRMDGYARELFRLDGWCPAPFLHGITAW
ncbi:MAG: hypothetical protein ACKPKO_63720, partial [Candidatus Fonsibacter sp.]